MNYLSHAIRFLDRPAFTIGTAVPDWLSVVDRRSRVRSRTIQAALSQLDETDRELASGILQHLHDDRWFHATPAFFQTTSRLAQWFREVLPPDDDWRCGFLGHLLLELLIDATFIEDFPQSLPEYYRALREVDPEHVEQLVSKLATKPPERLALFIDLFLRERFLEDYVDDSRLLGRLNQIMHRVKLSPLPVESCEVSRQGRVLVRESFDELLPPAFWTAQES